MKLKASAFKPLQDRDIRKQRICLEDVYKTLKKSYRSIRTVVNANEYPVLLDEVTVSDAATLDIGDETHSGYWNQYGALRVELLKVSPITDSQILYFRYGGGGSWWSDANYDFIAEFIGGSNATEVQCWMNSVAWLQGNGSGQECVGKLKIHLANALAEQGERTGMGELCWKIASGGSLMQAHISARYPTTKHVTALRFFYGSGNISGTSRLWGLRKT